MPHRMLASRYETTPQRLGMLAVAMALAAALMLALVGCAPQPTRATPSGGAIRVLFLGHPSEQPASHQPHERAPALMAALGRDAIYFDYYDDIAAALDPATLEKFDALLIYANYDNDMTDAQFAALDEFVRGGGGLVAVHSASASFVQREAYLQLIGGEFIEHGAEEFSATIIAPDHPAMAGVTEFTTWDETYVHKHRPEGRTVLMERRDAKGAEPWTWVREHAEGRVFYTASGHDQRTWTNPGFHALLKAGILWAVGDERRAAYDAFLASRAALSYEPRPTVANYEERPEPLPYQFPLSAEDSMKYIQVPVGFRLELVAAEPLVINPMQIAWDERGRLWVVESVDYPNNLVEEGGNDRIVILTDKNRDGRMDERTVFADGLNVPTSLVFANGGVIVSMQPDFVFLRDTNGDDRADERRVLVSGWSKADTHAGPSNLRYGHDNWIYGAIGYSGFDGRVAGESMAFANGVFRMRSDGSALEFLHQFNNNTWGVGLNSAGDVFGSTANGSPAFYGAIPSVLAARANAVTPSAAAIFDNARISPITPNIRQVDMFGEYTAAAGFTFANSGGFPEAWRDRIAFVSEPTGHLLGRVEIDRHGGLYKSKNIFPFLASADEWVSPIAAEIGPDGALYVVDWYEFIIQHNPTPTSDWGGYDAEAGAGNAHENPLRDVERGRIYRVVWEGAPEPKIRSLAGASDAKLVAALADDNQFWRLTAQRLLVDGKRTKAAPALRRRVEAGGVAAIHALWALAGLGALDDATLEAALRSEDPALRRAAARAAAEIGAPPETLMASGVLDDEDALVRLAAFNGFTALPATEASKAEAVRLAQIDANRQDTWLRRSLKLMLIQHGGLDAEARAPLLYPASAPIIAEPSLGEALFWNDKSANCSTCHKYFGYGGDMGPPLDGIGARRSREYLERAIMAPSADIAAGWGAPGEPSAMPDMSQILDEEQVAHVVAWLQTLTDPSTANPR